MAASPQTPATSEHTHLPAPWFKVSRRARKLGPRGEEGVEKRRCYSNACGGRRPPLSLDTTATFPAMTEITRRPRSFESVGRWPAFVERLTDLAVLPGDRPDLIKTKRLFTVALWASLLTGTVSVFQLSNADAPWAAAAVSATILAAVISLTLMKTRPTTYPAVMHLVAAATMLTTASMIVILGGVFESAANTAWSMLVVVGSTAIFGDRRAHFWFAMFVVTTFTASIAANQIEALYVLPNREYFTLFNLVSVTAFIYAILYYFVRQSDRLFLESENLLRNILPDGVIDRLKRSEEMIADEYVSASILFADVAGFTPMSARLEPVEVVNLLNEVFSDFDAMVKERGLEKIKTIGDAYMVAAGVPVSRDDHAVVICDLALEMQHHLGTRTFGGHHLSMRIGIASGPVMAGIIGRQKFSYDLWGDTVNLASRLETAGTPGKIQISEATCEAVSPWFECEERGVLDIKGKGPTPTWYLLGRRNG